MKSDKTENDAMPSMSGMKVIYRAMLAPLVSRRRGIFRSFILFVAVISIAVIYIGHKNYNGYCFAEGKYLTDAEKVRVAVADELSHYPPENISIYSEEWKRRQWANQLPGEPIRYRDVDDFLTQNPDCCDITLTRKEIEWSDIPFADRATGAVSSFMGLKYWIRSRDSDGKIHEIKNLNYTALSNCGKPIRWWTGFESVSDLIYKLIIN
nr:hypothetical protein [uncultured Undibacterium sp.]